MRLPTDYEPIPGNRDFRDQLAASRKPKFTGDSLKTGEDEKSKRWVKKYKAHLMKRARGMAPVNLPQRKSFSEVLLEYICALSMKKAMVLALAEAQVACEESEAMLLEVYSEAHLKRIRDVHYITDDPPSATGRYFDAVSGVCFDPLGP
ncbi:hypothetical protein JVT61DRAFT_10872 [Boletus reticuloceps]|uniref:Uncharacterized protein n=1 Tax=Boletus reticuloceps TaxID=495285 RepID=A0A8I2YF06_9AGAM|nr:hypothetical protein JVT61DRAFT_10872 [Boletus reticuloceps]